ncbi:MAG: toll/interleukin-1 receptor domain-containing protein [Candidatus Accumulibacter similis]|nr:MAG: toll/interleukin-1 receptor domain-containing protein [Candidatus Accumulibacter similis]
MADCFVSYKREDRGRVEGIVAALRDAGHSVWWDADVGGGARWRETIAAELEAARCVLVCWTSDSVGPAGTYVREEAERAKHRGVLLPLLLDRVAPPFGFGEVQALDLVDWDGRLQSPQWQVVLRATEAMLEGKAPPAAAVRRRRRAWTGGVVAAGLAAIGLLADLTGLHGSLCKPDSLATLCRLIGLGPSSSEMETWDQAKSASAGDALRVYLAKYPTGAFVVEAQARLAGCKKDVEVSWSPYLGTAPLVVPLGPIKAAPSEAAARQAMEADVQRDAEDACSAAPLSELYRPVPGARPDIPAQGWDCRSADQGWRCRYDGKITCQQERRQSVEREICPR